MRSTALALFGAVALVIGYTWFVAPGGSANGGSANEGGAGQGPLGARWGQVAEVGEAAGFSAPTVGVIDIEVVLDGMKRRAVLESQLLEEFRAKGEKLEKLEAEIESLRGEMALIQRGSDQFLALEKKLAYKNAERELDEKKVLNEFESRKAELFDQLLRDIHTATVQYADDEGIDLVFQKRLTLQPGSPSWVSVFHAREELVIDKAILEILNSEEQ